VTQPGDPGEQLPNFLKPGTDAADTLTRYRSRSTGRGLHRTPLPFLALQKELRLPPISATTH